MACTDPRGPTVEDSAVPVARHTGLARALKSMNRNALTTRPLAARSPPKNDMIAVKCSLHYHGEFFKVLSLSIDALLLLALPPELLTELTHVSCN